MWQFSKKSRKWNRENRHPFSNRLSGIGKAQTALEYAYRYHGNYQAVLWVGAETSEALLAGYQSPASLPTL